MASSFLQRRVEQTTLAACYGRYESDLAIAQYCDAHYGQDKFGVPNFSRQLSRLCVAAMSGKARQRALDLGCAVGRSCFELAPHFGQVKGIDYSKRFISTAQRLKDHGSFCYQIIEEGEVIEDRKISLAELGLSANIHNIDFCQGNAQQLDEKYIDFDLILAANLIDRLPDPGAFLVNIHKRLVVGGLLVIASPNNWREYFTPRKKWLGGHFRQGTPISSLQGLCKTLAKHFTMAQEPQDVEFVIRETARVFNHSISQVTFWQRDR